MINKEQQFFLCCISDFLNERKTTIEEVNDSVLCSYAKTQQLEGIIYYQTKNKILQSAFASQSFYLLNRERLLKRIHEGFAAANIPYLIFKGIEIAELYPARAMRSMGDSDIMVHANDKEKAGKVLSDLGLKNVSHGKYEWVFYYGNMQIELHSHLMNDELVSLPVQNKFMSSAWENASSDDGIQYHLNWNFHLLYLFLHLRKHFMNSGAGFRQFIDIAIVSKKCKIDWNKFEITADELQIKGFVKTCFALISRWFETEIPISVPNITDEFYETATQQVFDNGVFGFEDDENRENYTVLQLKYTYNKTGKLGLMIHSLFPSYDEMVNTQKYFFVNGKPWFMPIAWIYRMVYSLLHKTARKRASEIRDHLSVSQSRIVNREGYLKEWGL